MRHNHSCEEIWDLLSVYADGEATPEESARVEHHITECQRCARDLAFLRETARALEETPEIAPPPGLRDAILAATIYRPSWPERVRAALGGALAPVRRHALALAGTAAAGFLCALLLFRSPSSPPAVWTGGLSPQTKRLAVNPTPNPPLPEEEASSGPAFVPPRPAPRLPAAPPPVRILTADVRLAESSRPRALAFARQKSNIVATGASRRASTPPGSREEMHVKPVPHVDTTPASSTEEAEEMEMRMAETMTERMKSGESLTERAGMKTAAAPPSSASPPNLGRLTLVATSMTVDPGSVSTLADLRRSLRREQENLRIRGSLYTPGERNTVTLDVIKTRF